MKGMRKMLKQRIAETTRDLGKPRDWDESKGKCGSLPIRDEQRLYGNVMVSAWQPTPAELKRLNDGANIELTIVGIVHPPVSVEVGDIPRADGVLGGD
jgi:hypothetical protein